jgi:formylglycine-generating enzyme required for sulfatase activity
MSKLLFVCLAFGVAVASWSAGPAADADAARIDRLIQQLGSDKFTDREEAAKSLEALGGRALEALRKAATGSADAEVRRRARQLMALLTPSPLDCTGDDGVSPADMRKAQEAWAKYLGRKVEETIEVTDGVKMTFVLVPPGKFRMGSPQGENHRHDDETLHEVTLTEPFDMAKTEVTQAQYRVLVGENPSHFKGDDLPVGTVNWTEARDWTEKLTTKRRDKHLYRLPTEAEWEYSCRGGRSSSQPFGIGNGLELSSREANFRVPDEGAGQGTGSKSIRVVASYPANAFGLHDLHGNVWEWCSDWDGPSPGGAVTNPLGPAEGLSRVLRGGCWCSSAGSCRAAKRDRSWPSYRAPGLGFRLARTLPPAVK